MAVTLGTCRMVMKLPKVVEKKNDISNVVAKHLVKLTLVVMRNKENVYIKLAVLS